MSGKTPAGRQPSVPDPEDAPQQVDELEIRPQTWADPGTWSASFKFLPAQIVLVAIFIAVYWNRYTEDMLDVQDYDSCKTGFNYTFGVNAARSRAQELAESAREIAWAFDATQENYDPQRSVFGPNPFPNGKVPTLGLRLDEASLYFDKRMQSDGNALLLKDNVVDSSTALLGIPSVMFGQKWSGKKSMNLASSLKDTILQLPAYGKDAAISHRFEAPELWAEASGFLAPFLAYYGVATNNLTLVKEAARQVHSYRDNLVLGTGTRKGLWKHSISEAGDIDGAVWSPGNAMAAYGMAKLRAIISAWPQSNSTMAKELDDLDFWIQELLDAAIETDDEPSGLLRNYLGDSSWEGETSGTALLAATAYRMARIRPEVFAQAKYIDWADRKRLAVFARVDDGAMRSVADASKPQSRQFLDLSAEGESFLLLLGTAWRDVICSGVSASAAERYFAETQSKPIEPEAPLTFESVTGYSLSELMKAYQSRLRQFYASIWKAIKQTFEGLTGYSVDTLYAQAMEPVRRYVKYFSGPS